ncbi:MAG TPA: hypothetical protein VFR30_07970, partial [Lysobacter sp.]|nr:hypothetical protein [Lysobacter sp.]
NAGRLSQIRQQQQEIRDETERSTGRYVRFDKAELARLRDAQDKVFELLKGVTDPDQLSPAQQAELFNALETVKAVIARNDADRQVCWREKKLGSHRIETRCATVAERAQIRQGARDWHGEPSTCMPSAGATVSCGRGSD